MSEERCVLCNKSYEYEHYHLFGRGCLSNLYNMLEISKPPRKTKDKEMYLCNRIAWRNHKFFLSKSKKYALTQKYVAVKYLDKINFNKYPYIIKTQGKDIDQNSIIESIKEKISKDMKNISLFSNKIIESVNFHLHNVYDFFNDTQRFEEMIKEIQNLDLEELDKELTKRFFIGMKDFFDLTEKEMPILYEGNYTVQYLFWKLVIIGGLMVNMKLSAKLLDNALTFYGQNDVKDLEITEEEYTQIISKDTEFIKLVNKLVEDNAQNKNEIDITYKELVFDDYDLHFSLHKATMILKGKKKSDNIWDLEIELSDTYDFTEFKRMKHYFDSSYSIPKSLLSTTLNNLGVASSEYGVLKSYEVVVKFTMNNHDITEVIDK